MATKDADTSGGHIQPLPLDAFPIDTSGGNLHPLPRDAFPIGDSYVEQYKAAAKSLKANEYLANLPAFMVSNETVDKLRGIQATYKCRQQHRLDLGYNFLLVTVWDHDRLWVSPEKTLPDSQMLNLIGRVQLRSLAWYSLHR